MGSVPQAVKTRVWRAANGTPHKIYTGEGAGLIVEVLVGAVFAAGGILLNLAAPG